jgi:putative resolvase
MTNGSQYVSGSEASQRPGISQQTLRTHTDQEKIVKSRRPAGGQRRYNVDKYIAGKVARQATVGKSIVYARVSTRKQRRDLDHQVEFLRAKFPEFDVIADTGVNWRGFKRILELALSGDVETVAVAHKDRLCRIAFDLVEWVLRRHRCKTIVVQGPSVCEGPDAEFVDDILSIIHSFSARTYGHRSYRTGRNKEDDDLPAESDKGDA